MGPELTAVTARRSDDWIRQYLKNPQAMNPDARMPPYPLLTSRERQEIIEYLKR
jgi:cbb3-type cytochrome oxidase cytochrome c subunit